MEGEFVGLSRGSLSGGITVTGTIFMGADDAGLSVTGANGVSLTVVDT